MKAGLTQFAPELHNITANLQNMLNSINNNPSDIMVFPELSLSGYLFTHSSQVRACAETIPGPSFSELQKAAERTNTLVIYGCIEKVLKSQIHLHSEDIGIQNTYPHDNECVYFNSACAVSRDGTYHIYRKAHLFDREKLFFSQGNTPFSVFTYKNIKIGMLICFDHIFPEAARSLALQGAQIICHPSNLVLPGTAQLTTRVRTIENRVFWILANRTGKETLDGLSYAYTGNSCIFAPGGILLAAGDENHESVICCDINPIEADNKQITPLNNLLEDRRESLYYHN